MSKQAKVYAIIDVETTGGRANRDRVIDVGIVLFDGLRIIDQWESLVNPETYIPRGITELTGITQEMVADAPRFHEIARKVVEMTEGHIFVAHNARFDYSFLREEFARLGYTFTRKQLCTLRLSRQAFPGFSSYGLDNLCFTLGINNQARHRALGDALATTELLSQILSQEDNYTRAEDIINLGIREALLPANLSLEKIHALPDACGVYYFHNTEGDVIYVGKSINIQKRIAEHFADKTEKARKLQQMVHEVSYEVTGSELVALLLESHEIKRLRPTINRAQRQRLFPYVVHTWINGGGYQCFGVHQATAGSRQKLEILADYPKISNARNHLLAMQARFELCSHLLTASSNGSGPCFHYHLKQCSGACIGQEKPTSYNERAQQAAEALRTRFDNSFFVIDRGREEGEWAVVLVEEGLYQGYGFWEGSIQVTQIDELRDVIRPLPGNAETNRLIYRFLEGKNPQVKVIPLS